MNPFVALALLVVLLLPAARAEPVTFGLFGDMPYNRWERENLPALIAEMDAAGLAFVINDGDIKSGASACDDATLRDILDEFRKAATPLVYVPGDNEWTDCHRRSAGGYDPLERLARLRELFYPDDFALGGRPLRLERQSRDPDFAAYRENVRWEVGGVLFVGLHVVGSRNNYDGGRRGSGPVPEFVERSRANHTWLARAFAIARERRLAGVLVAIQANPGFEADAAGRPDPAFKEFIDQLREETLAFAGQVALVHGDTHSFRIDRPLTLPTTGAALDYFTRVETIGSPHFGWVRGTADAEDPQVFRFEARFWRADPGRD